MNIDNQSKAKAKKEKAATNVKMNSFFSFWMILFIREGIWPSNNCKPISIMPRVEINGARKENSLNSEFSFTVR